MHPQAFLKTFWRLELRPQIFVAMSFGPQYQRRFETVIAPAIAGINYNSQILTAYRVDLSKTGDSILTDIVDGIAHSQLVLADVSTIGKDAVTGTPYRNGNVMYEVGIALSCRHPSEVLLVRDDEDKFLFDISSIPHMKIDFTDTDAAVASLRDALLARFRERQQVYDARVQLAVAGLGDAEVNLLRTIADYPVNAAWGVENADLMWLAGIPRLLDKQLIRMVGKFEKGHLAYAPTPLGRIVIDTVRTNLHQFTADPWQKPEDTGSASP